MGGVNAVGTIGIGKFDERRNESTWVLLGTYEIDDHNVPAFLIEADRPPLVAIVRHAVEPFVRVRVGAAPYDVESLKTATEIQVPFPGACTYANLIRRPGTSTLALITRNADGWYISVSTNWGNTWSAAVKFTGLAYNTFYQVGKIVHYVTAGHPVTSVNNSVRYIRIDTVSGDIVNAAGDPVGNLWSFTAAIALASMTCVRQAYDTDPGYNTFRTLDVGPSGSVLAMTMLKERPELGGTYGVYRFAPTGATPNASQPPMPRDAVGFSSRSWRPECPSAITSPPTSAEQYSVALTTSCGCPGKTTARGCWSDGRRSAACGARLTLWRCARTARNLVVRRSRGAPRVPVVSQL
jgi:hypothetical protein